MVLIPDAEMPEASPNRVAIRAFALIYAALLAAFWVALPAFGRHYGSHLVPLFLSFALLLAPYLFLGFGGADLLRNAITSRTARILAGAAFVVPYLVFSIPSGQFRWQFCAIFLLLPIVVNALADSSRNHDGITFQDALALLILGLPVMFRWLNGGWPDAGLGGFLKFLLTDVGVYSFLVVRGLRGAGYDFRFRADDLRIGLRELLFFTPIVLALGFALRFIHFHAVLPPVLKFVMAWPVTFLFVAVPEEFFFRSTLQNLLEPRLGRRGALILASIFFGLSHYNKHALFNWRYVILASLAGIFYGRAWRNQRRIAASAITHTAVDVIWGAWFL